MGKKKGKRKIKNPQTPKQQKPPEADPAENKVNDKETVETAENTVNDKGTVETKENKINDKETVETAENTVNDKGTVETKENKVNDKETAPLEEHVYDSDSDSDLDLEENHEDGENYDEKLEEKMDPWRVLDFEGRKEGLKSFSDLLRELDRSDDEETRISLHAVKSTVTGLGIKLSRLIIEYFSLFWRYEPKEMAAKTHATANTIRHESLGGLEAPMSVITDRFVAVVELMERRIMFPRHYNDWGEDDSDFEEYEDHVVWVNKRENRILGLIFYRVLFLEVLYCCPFFSGGATAAEKKDWAEKVCEFVAKESGFKAKLKKLELEIIAMKREELENEKNMACNEGLDYTNKDDLENKRRKALLDGKIKEIWNGL